MKRKRLDNPSAQGFFGQPSDCFELVNKYGTYNIQPTADADNPFPMIAQGLPRSLADEAQKAATEVQKTYGAKQKKDGLA
ncbi:MAG: hypothetical protein IJT18_02225 [Oscillospiraceae bacterium]|nr:hypothetical protein [Oscillospiraceae bacterium]